MTNSISKTQELPNNTLQSITRSLRDVSPINVHGKVFSLRGLAMEIVGLEGFISVGDQCSVNMNGRDDLLCEVVGFANDKSLIMPYGDASGVSLGSAVSVVPGGGQISPHSTWKGRVLDALARPIDGKGDVSIGRYCMPIRTAPPNSYSRKIVDGKLDTCVKALDVFVPLNRGQRMGIFAGSGVGKSSLLSMISRSSNADINVIALVGERGREVKEFILNDLGEEGLSKSVVVVSTSDDPPLMRRQAAWTAMTIAEFFRNQGLQVAFMMDSVTRFAMAQREIGLASGEPPTTKGYPPTVFAELPRLLERSGPGVDGSGDITGIFTVLVDGDDHNEPISDAVRGILDGHVVLDRKVAERGRFPSINILKSVSRMLPSCHNEEELAIYNFAKDMIASYEDMADMIRIGAYQKGSDPKVDASLMVYQQIENFLKQAKADSQSPADTFSELKTIIAPAESKMSAFTS